MAFFMLCCDRTAGRADLFPKSAIGGPVRPQLPERAVTAEYVDARCDKCCSEGNQQRGIAVPPLPIEASYDGNLRPTQQRLLWLCSLLRDEVGRITRSRAHRLS